MSDEPRNYVASWSDGSPRGAIPLLVAVTTTGAGATYVLPKPISSFGIEYFRGTTTALLESTAAPIVIQGRLGSTAWHSIGTGITVNSATPAVALSTNAIPFTQVRCSITSFTTSAGAGSTAERRIPITVYLTPSPGRSS